MKPVSYKRIFAYIIDILIVSVIASLLSSFLPMSEAYEKANDEFFQAIEDYTSKNLEEDEYLEKLEDISYTISRESVSTNIIIVLVGIGYFVVFAYLRDGETLGKKVMKMKIVSNDDSKKLTLTNYLIRSLIVNSLLLDTVDIILILCLNKTNYLNAFNISSTIRTSLYIVIIGMILFEKNGRGLHDILAGTKVISLSNDTNSIKDTTTMEACVIDEKKEENDKDDNIEKTKKITSKETKNSKTKKETNTKKVSKTTTRKKEEKNK